MENSNSTKILLIDDERPIAETIEAYAKRENMSITHALQGEEGMSFFEKGRYDIVLVDWMLPGMSGLDIIKRIREKNNTPILMISARNDEADIVLGLEIGADDYITKPFGPREMIARIHSLLRRHQAFPQTPSGQPFDISFGDVTISFEKKEIKKAGKALPFTSAEFHILEELCSNQGKVVSRENLMINALGYRDFLNDRTLDTHIKNIRKKIEDDPKNPQIIKTVREAGFKCVIPSPL